MNDKYVICNTVYNKMHDFKKPRSTLCNIICSSTQTDTQDNSMFWNINVRDQVRKLTRGRAFQNKHKINIFTCIIYFIAQL